MPTCLRASLLGAPIIACLATGCTPGHMAMNRMASTLASAGSVYESDNDPEFVRLAAPSTLKTVEMLLTNSPRQPQLLLTACSGFTEYSYAFLQVEADLRASDAGAARDLRERAARMYLRARAYCLRGLEVRHPGLSLQALTADPAAALRQTTIADVPWLYWTGASWGAELSLAPDAVTRIAEIVPVRALLGRARSLDDAWEQGAIPEAMIAFDGLPALLGGSPAAARADFDRAMELSDHKSVFAYVALAATITDPAEKRRLLNQAAAIDVGSIRSRRLTNIIAQRYARAQLTAAR